MADFSWHVLLLFSDDFCINGLFLTLSAFIILVGYFGLHQPVIFTSRDHIPPIDYSEENIRYSGSLLKDEDVQKYLVSLADYMKTKKPYLNNQLTLYQLAEEVNILPQGWRRSSLYRFETCRQRSWPCHTSCRCFHHFRFC